MPEFTRASVVDVLRDLVAVGNRGTLFSAVIHKVGVERGAGLGKRVYDDDVVRVLLWTCSPYVELVRRSDTILRRELDRGGFIGKLARSTLEKNEKTTLADACHALQEIRANFHKVLAPQNGDPGPDDLYEPRPDRGVNPLTIDGRRVHSCSVYRSNSDQPGGPSRGDIYVEGIKLGQIVVTPAPNGSWQPSSKPKTVAKSICKQMLPVGRYRWYRLAPDRVSEMTVNGAAAEAARKAGIPIDPALVSMLLER